MPGQLRAVLFDWDGTLVNSAETSFRCFERLFASLGIPFGRDDYERTYSPNWHRTYTAMGVPEERWTEADARWVSYYAEEQSVLLSGTRAALERLRQRGIVTGIVSSGDRDRVCGELSTHEIAERFATVVCAQDAPRRKPDPAPLLLALERLQLRPDETAYVGDSPEDVEMARAAGVFAVGVPGAFPNQRALAASSPDLLASSLEEAIDALLGHAEATSDD
jgi:HAD superfamily hydrolase (TIGR01509 family)